MPGQIPNISQPIAEKNGQITRPWYLFLNLFTGAAASGTLNPGQIAVGGATPGTVAGGDLSGDVTTAGSTVTTLATVNGAPGTFGDSTHVAQVTVNGKGLVTAASNVAIAGGSGTVTHTGTLTSGTLIQGNGGADITLNATSATVTKLTSGVPSAATAGTDYVAPGSITSDGITMATARLLGRTTASTGAVEEITVGTGLSLSAGSLTSTGGTGTVTHTGGLTANQLVVGNGTADIKVSDLTGDVTTSGGVATTIANSAVTYAKIQNVSANSKLLGSSATGSGASPSEITVGTGLTMTASTLSSTVTGTVTTTGSPASGNLSKFSGATSITNADLTGDVTTSGGVATTIANSAVTYAKIQNVSASSRVLGSSSTGSGAAPSELSLGTGLAISGSTLSATGTGGGGVSGVIDSIGGTTITNDGTEQTLYTFSMAGATMSATQSVRLTVLSDYINNIGGTVRWRIYYGATTMYDATSAGISTSGNHHSQVNYAHMGNTGATGAQYLSFFWYLSNATAATTGQGAMSAAMAAAGLGGGSATEDSTTTLTFKVTITHSSNNSGIVTVRKFATLELI